MAKLWIFDDADNKDDGTDEELRLNAPDIELEGKDLETHVRRCILRYISLKKGQKVTQKILRRVEIWVIIVGVYMLISNFEQFKKVLELL